MLWIFYNIEISTIIIWELVWSKLYYQQLHLKYLCNLARYWLQAPWGWHDSVETCRSLIICEIILHSLVIVQNLKKIVCLYEACPMFTLFLTKWWGRCEIPGSHRGFAGDENFLGHDVVSAASSLVTDVSNEPSTFVLRVKKRRWAAWSC